MTYYARWILVILLIFSCFGDGSGGDWAGTVALAGSFLVLILGVLKNPHHNSQLYNVPGMLPLAALSGLFLLQLLPLPHFLLELLSPGTFRLYAETTWVVLPDSWLSISLVPKATLAGFFQFSACIAVFVATVQLIPTLEITKKTLFLLVAATGLFSFLAMIRLLFWPQPAAESLGGGNALLQEGSGDYTVLVAMLVPVIVGVFLGLKSRAAHFKFPGQRIGPLTLSLYTMRLISGFCLLPVLGFLLVTSRVWMLQLCVGGLLLFAALVLGRRVDRKWGAIFSAVSLCLLLGLVVMHWSGGTEGTLGELGPQQLVRQSDLEEGLETFRRFPLVGTGYATSQTLSDRPAVVNGDKFLSVAGQSFLGRQLGQGGVLGAALSVWFLVLLLGRCLQSWFRRKSRASIYLFAGVLGGVVVLIVHGMTAAVKHPLPLSLFFSCLLGLLVSVSHSRSRSHMVDTELPRMSPRGRTVTLTIGVGVGMALLAFQGGVAAARFSADGGKDEGADMRTPEVQAASLDAARLAARLDPLEYRYRLTLGELALEMESKPLAVEGFSAALKLNPLSRQALRRLGLILSSTGEGRVGDDGRGEVLLRAAAEYHPGEVQQQRDYALWLCSRSRYQDSFPYLQRSFALEPERAGELLLLMSACGLEDEALQWALGEDPAAWVGYGDLLLGRGAEEGAEASYIAAAKFATAGNASQALPFLRLYEFYSERGRRQEALDAVLRGIQTFPNDPRFRLAAGTLYQQLGIVYRAIEEYRKTLLLDPGNELAGLGLRELTLGR